MEFTAILLRWYKNNYRDLPWKHTNDPYKIWLSEIILQQTRVEQGMPYYTRFVERFPTVQHLAAAPIDEVMKLWQGLGYYSRARNLHFASQQIVKDYGGKMPHSYRELLKLKGVGAYTAAAIASFAFKEPVVALDGNGYRIFARFFGIEIPFDTATCKRQITEEAQAYIPQDAPDVFNQALMDFGSMVCIPQKPSCAICPLHTTCIAYAKGLVRNLPIRSKKKAVRQRYFNYILIRNGSDTYVRKRTKKDIWRGLYEFPLIETSEVMNPDDLFKTPEWNKLMNGTQPEIRACLPTVKHQLSHQTIWTSFYLVNVPTSHAVDVTDGYFRIHTQQIDSYVFSQLIERELSRKEVVLFFLS